MHADARMKIIHKISSFIRATLFSFCYFIIMDEPNLYLIYFYERIRCQRVIVTT